jgi:hypothetical protein
MHATLWVPDGRAGVALGWMEPGANGLHVPIEAPTYLATPQVADEWTVTVPPAGDPSDRWSIAEVRVDPSLGFGAVAVPVTVRREALVDGTRRLPRVRTIDVPGTGRVGIACPPGVYTFTVDPAAGRSAPVRLTLGLGERVDVEIGR